MSVGWLPVARACASVAAVHRAMVPLRWRCGNEAVASSLPVERVDAISAERCKQLSATLELGASTTGSTGGSTGSSIARGAPRDGDPAPLLSHWLGWQTACPLSRLGKDGHPRRGGPHGISPDVPESWRRMFGGSTIDVHGTGPAVGQPLRRASRLGAVVDKRGAASSSSLKLCTLVHEYACTDTGRLELTETQSIVYIAPPEGEPDETAASGEGNHAGAGAGTNTAGTCSDQSAQQHRDSQQHRRRRQPPRPRLVPDGHEQPELARLATTTTMLFRYSALTFNGHRIHYDADYARDVEGYEGLVVHGPLLATALATAAVERVAAPAGLRVARFSWRALEPVICGEEVALHSAPPPSSTSSMESGSESDVATVPLYVLKGHGGMAVQGEMTLVPA